MVEIQSPRAELNSSAKLFSQFQKSGGGESCLAQSKTGIQETGAAHDSPTGNKETCADIVSISPSQASFITQRTIPAIAISKMVTKMVRHHKQDEQQSDAALHWDTMRPVLLSTISQRNIGFDLFMKKSSKTKFKYCENSQKFLSLFSSISRTLL